MTAFCPICGSLASDHTPQEGKCSFCRDQHAPSDIVDHDARGSREIEEQELNDIERAILARMGYQFAEAA